MRKELKSTDSFVVRKYKEGDEKGIVELMRLCFGRVDSDYLMKRWVWEFKENPLGNIIWVVEYDGQIIAHSSHIPIDLKVGSKIFKSCIGADAMTHPNFRREGLQERIYAAAHAELVKKGIHFEYFFPGEILLKYSKHRNGSSLIGKIPILVKLFDVNDIVQKYIGSNFSAKIVSAWLKLYIGSFFRFGRKNSFVEDVKITEIAQFNDRINIFWKDVSRHFDVIVVRNREYLNWRYFKRPNSNFRVLLAKDHDKILGYIVFCLKDEKGYIVDLLVYPHRLDVAQSLIRLTEEQLRVKKAHRIICWMLKNNAYYRVLRAGGFIPFSIHSFPIVVSLHSPSNVPAELVTNLNNWHLTLSDTDGIII